MKTPGLSDTLSAALFEQAPFSAVLYDRDGRVLAINAAFTAFMGIGPADLTPEYSILTDPQLEARGVMPLVRRAFAGERISLPPIRYDSRAHTSSGRVIWAQAQLFPLREPDGSVARVVLVHQDLTDRMHMEESLRAAQQELSDERTRLEIIINGISHGVTVQDAAGRLIYANDAAAALIGFASAHEVLHATIAQILAAFEMFDEHGRPLDMDRLPGRRALLGEQDPVQLVRYRLRASGEEHWSLVRARAVTVGSQRLAVNVFQDISDRIRQQQALEWSEQRASFLAEAGKVLASSLDYHTTLKAVVRLAVPRVADWCTISMLDDDGMLRRIELAHHDPARLELAAELERRYPQHPDRSAIYRVATSGVAEMYSEVTDDILAAAAVDEEHLALLRAIGFKSAMIVPLTVQGRTLGALTFVSSESGRRYDDADLRFAESLATRAALAINSAEAYGAAQEANLAKSRFLAVMSHELRTPLNAILGYTDLLDAEVSGELNAAQREHLMRIGQSAQHLTQLIETILSFARIDAGKEEVRIESTELGHIVVEAAALLQPSAARRGLKLTHDVERGVVAGTDVARLRQILLNLISNAVKFTEQGGVTVTLRRVGGAAVIEVSDTGPGISPGDLPRIWEPFTRLGATLTRNTGGAGLGLTVSASLAELIGARIEVRSEVGKGSTFVVRIPLGERRS